MSVFPSEELNLGQEFNLRMRHDFSKYLLLISKSIKLSEDYILQVTYQQKGYLRHKTVKYGKYTSHIIVLFETRYLAKKAGSELNKMNCGPTAVTLDIMLRDWFTYEIETSRGPHCSLTIVDIIGKPPHNINLLKSNVLNVIFEDYGTPYLLPYTAALKKPHLQVLFASMTEALAACIAFGEWYRINKKTDCFFYRVRINPSSKEESLIKNCGGTPLEAFKLSYFIKLKTEEKSAIGKNSVTKAKELKTKIEMPIAMQTSSKEKCTSIKNSCLQLKNPFGHGTPILYFPIIATNYNNAHASKNQLGTDFTTALLNFEQHFKSQTVVAIANPGMENNIVQSRSSDEIVKCNRDSKKTEHPSNDQNCNRTYQSHTHVSVRSHDINRRATRIFERRKYVQ